MSPLVTIGIPCFNTERWISAAVQSALDQTWPAKEVIVVDDGSSDGSLAALEKFGDAVRVVCAEHRGGNHARNLIVENARGEWVQFLDADDYLEPEKIAQQFSETSGGEDADVIYSPTWLEDSRKNTRLPSELDPSLDLFAQWLAWQMPQTGGALWRKTTLDALGGWKESQPCCQEHELYLRALQAGARFRFAPTPHAVYRLWSEETLCRRDPRKVIHMRTSLMDQLQKWMTPRGLWSPVHARVAGRAFFEMSRSLANHDLEEAARYFHDRKSRGLIHLAGPAAPRSYRMALCLLGFTGTEKLAAIRR
jgi:glycosyltransferase involved in cell wall biosynthesis